MKKLTLMYVIFSAAKNQNRKRINAVDQKMKRKITIMKKKNFLNKLKKMKKKTKTPKMIKLKKIKMTIKKQQC